jgi:hypothetical protein
MTPTGSNDVRRLADGSLDSAFYVTRGRRLFLAA